MPGGNARWPAWVYRAGQEPDPRFTLANERTCLAWLRTSLALLAAGVAFDALGVPRHDAVRSGLVALLVLLAALSSAGAFVRWARAERAMRRAAPLPSPSLAAVLSACLTIGALVLLYAVSVG